MIHHTRDRRLPDDLERFQPVSFDDIVGNDELKEYFRDLIYCVRVRGHISGFNLIATGPSRDGKTATITLGVKALLCCNLNLETMTPCNRCVNCTAKYHLYGNDGWNNSVDLFGDDEHDPMPVRFHYFPVDCTQVDSKDIDDLLGKLRLDDGNLKIVYLDEVHRLSRRWMDERLLKPLEMYHAIWLASSAAITKTDGDDDQKLDKMFQNRFSYRIKTQRPTPQQMFSWLVARCRQFEITVEDVRTTLPRLIDRSNQSPGLALQVLNKAHKTRQRRLSKRMVEEHVFDLDD